MISENKIDYQQPALFDVLTSDERFIIEHVISSWDVEQARKLPTFGEQVEHVRRRTVMSSCGGYRGNLFYQTGSGVIRLADGLSPAVNVRTYKIRKMARLALEWLP
jgi:hypothetical protein